MSLTAAQRGAVQQQLTVSPVDPPAPSPPAVITGSIAIDVSNYTGPLMQATLQKWKQNRGVGLVIVQAVEPPPGYPAGQTRQQVQACAHAGIPTDVYLFPWTSSNVEADMRTKLALLNGLEQYVRKLWLDVEDTSPSSPDYRVTTIRQAFAVLDGWSQTHGKPRPGLYTGRWWWQAYVSDTTEFADRSLWDSAYDGVPNVNAGWIPYGGWQSRRIKQYVGTSTLDGQGGIDINVLSDAEMGQ